VYTVKSNWLILKIAITTLNVTTTKWESKSVVEMFEIAFSLEKDFET
jgi:hypothetical protein